MQPQNFWIFIRVSPPGGCHPGRFAAPLVTHWRTERCRTWPLENSDKTVLVVGGVHWLSTQHLYLIASSLNRYIRSILILASTGYSNENLMIHSSLFLFPPLPSFIFSLPLPSHSSLFPPLPLPFPSFPFFSLFSCTSPLPLEVGPLYFS